VRESPPPQSDGSCLPPGGQTPGAVPR
jgi:hypothetical protein